MGGGSHAGLPKDVANAWTALLVSVFLGGLMIWTAVAALSLRGYLLAFAGTMLVVVLLIYVLDKLTNDVGEPASRLAWVPIACIALAFVGYGVTLSLVHRIYVTKLSTAYYQRVNAIEHEYSVQFAKEKKQIETRGSTARALEEFVAVVDIDMAASHREFSKMKAIAAKANFAAGGEAKRTADTVTRMVLPNRDLVEPSNRELPPWFGLLGGFFTVATQLLAGLVVVLAFSRWRGGTSEAVYRAAMPVAVLGVVFGLVGNLPALSRTFQAILLGPVIAGLAGAVGALLLAAIEVRPSAPARRQA